MNEKFLLGLAAGVVSGLATDYILANYGSSLVAMNVPTTYAISAGVSLAAWYFVAKKHYPEAALGYMIGSLGATVYDYCQVS